MELSHVEGKAVVTAVLFCTDLVAVSSVLDAPQDDPALGRHRHHLIFVSVRAADHLGVKGDALDGPVQVRTREDLLPPGRFLYPSEKKPDVFFLMRAMSGNDEFRDVTIRYVRDVILN